MARLLRVYLVVLTWLLRSIILLGLCFVLLWLLRQLIGLV